MRSRNGVLSYTESEYRGISLPVLDTYLSQFFFIISRTMFAVDFCFTFTI